MLGGFRPTSISGLKLWLKADAGLYQDSGGTTPATADDDRIGLWQDQSGQGNHASQATSGKRPTLKLAIQNGRPVVRFDGADDGLANALFSAFGTADFSLFMVLASGNLAGYRTALELASPTGGALGAGLIISQDGANNDGTAEYGRIGADFLSTTAPGLVANTFATWEGVHSAGTFRAYADGVAATPASAASGLNITEAGCMLGYAFFGGIAQFWQGHVGEAIIYDTALTDGDRQHVESYLRARWGTP
jgi:hypothetical protein